jgi:hypothetical protein
VERLPSAEAARRGGYTAGSFRVLVHQFRQNPDRQFFLPAAKGPKTAPKADRLREKVIRILCRNTTSAMAAMAGSAIIWSPTPTWL